MEIINCRHCGRLFQYHDGPGFCPRCVKVLEERFRLVKDYIYDNPEVTAQIVAEEFGISVQTIIRWVREERLEFSHKSKFTIPCEFCRDKIKMGRYCVKCKNELANKLSAVYQFEEEKRAERIKEVVESSRMRFLKSY